MPKSDGICRMCACKTTKTDGCPRRIHSAHPMVEYRNTGYFYCPEHDRVREPVAR